MKKFKDCLNCLSVGMLESGADSVGNDFSFIKFKINGSIPYWRRTGCRPP